jgi:hypothetical protein
MKPIILIGLLLLIAGCGKTYQSVAVENLKMQPHSYDKKTDNDFWHPITATTWRFFIAYSVARWVLDVCY